MKITDVLDFIKDKEKERSILMDQFRLWHDIEAQGINPEQVVAFCFDRQHAAKHLPYRERAWLYGMQPSGLAPYWFGPWLKGGSPAWFNAVRMRDGGVLYLDPMVKAAKLLVKVK